MNNAIDVKGLYLSYDNKSYILRDASFNIKQKEIVIITGVSGSGKSTLIKAIYGDMKIDGGSLKVFNQEVNGINKNNLKNLRQNIGIVFQDYKLINEYSAEENVALPLIIKGYKKAFCKSQAKKLLAHVSLSLKSKKYPLELSGGEQQRVGVARAISHTPKIILADEPTGNLDEYSSNMIWDLFIKASKELNSCVIVVTHTAPPELDDFSYRRLHLDNGVLNEIY